MKKPSRSKPSSKTTLRVTRAKSSNSTTAPTSGVDGELHQLATIRAGFQPIEAKLAQALHARHDDDACRARGTRTRGAEIFRAGMNWARTFADHRSDPVVAPVRVRWFLDCLTDLGQALTGVAHAGDPTATAVYLDAVHVGDRLWQRTVRRARAAVGSNARWLAPLEAAIATVETGLDDRAARLTRFADLLDQWLASSDAPPLAAFDLGASTVRELRDAARSTSNAVANRPAAKQIDRDGPEVNVAEGRVVFAMRVLWDDLAEGRSEGKTNLQLTAAPAVVRALDLQTHHRKPTAPPAKSPTA